MLLEENAPQTGQAKMLSYTGPSSTSTALTEYATRLQYSLVQLVPVVDVSAEY